MVDVRDFIICEDNIFWLLISEFWAPTENELVI